MKSHKKLFAVASSFLFFSFLFVGSVKADQQNNPIFASIQYVQNAISSALSPVQSSVTGLSNRVSNLEATVTPIPGQIANIQATLTPIPGQIANEHEYINQEIRDVSSRISGLENRISILENISNDGDFQATFKNTSFEDGSSEWRPAVHIFPTWKGVAIPTIQTHGVWHAASGDIPFVVDGGDLLYPFSFTTSIPVTIPIDIYVFWQGVTKHFTYWVTVPH
jgi:hypothetical protein